MTASLHHSDNDVMFAQETNCESYESNPEPSERLGTVLEAIAESNIGEVMVATEDPEIIDDVKKNGDKALLKYEKKFNQNKIIVPTANQISQSIKSLDKKVKNAIDLAYTRIYKFHSLQKFKNISYSDKFKNRLDYKYLPIESVAIYVPGSAASYPSSVLMSAIPAIVAGVKRIVMINPGYKGSQNPAVLYAARKCKIKEIYSIGGPSAIAAAAYGTKKIKKVDKIVGPGNSFVAAAKKEVFGDVGIEGMTAGPSEILIVCDKFSNPEWVEVI